ncbi:MAG: hypothetical protein RLZZ618_4262 [Pseudomonadota bacterium]
MVMRADRRAALHWAGYAAATGLSLLVFVTSSRPDGEAVRAVGNVLAALGVLLLYRGVRRFAGHNPGWSNYLAALGVVTAVAWLGMRHEYVALRVGVVAGLLCVLCWLTAWEIRLYARDQLRLRWGALLALPLFLGSLVFAARCLNAAWAPAQMVAEITANRSLNTGSALMFLVTGLVFHLALAALVASRLMAELSRLSRHDGLTELLNRRAMEEQLEQEARRAARTGNAFAILMLDVDHFKAINDTHGHAAGDSALRYLAALLRSQMRDVDFVGRVGGEEFLALLPESSVAQGMTAAQRIRDALLQHPHEWQGKPLPFTVSTGIAAWQGHPDRIDLLMRRADAALYRAKSLGRDRFETHGAAEAHLGPGPALKV